MRLDILNSYSWEETNESVAKMMDPGGVSTGSWRVYSGLAAAVTETGLGAGIFYSHRKQFGIISGNTWAFEALIPHLMKENFKQFEISHNHEEAELVSQVGGETNFVLWAKEHPVTAQVFDRSKLVQELAAKKIYSIVVSHIKPEQAAPLDPYEVRIYSVASDLAIAHVGSRFKAPPLYAHRLVWDSEKVIQQIKLVQNSFYENEKIIRDFEQEIDSTFSKALVRSFLDSSVKRIWDRSVFLLSRHNAEDFLVNQVFELKDVGQGSQNAVFPLGIHADLISRCYRQPVPELHKWWKPLLTHEDVRGMAILSAEWLSHGVNRQKLLGALKDLKA